MKVYIVEWSDGYDAKGIDDIFSNFNAAMKRAEEAAKNDIERRGGEIHNDEESFWRSEGDRNTDYWEVQEWNVRDI